MINHTLIQNALRIKAKSLVVATATAFSRASTATYTDVNNIVRTAAINVVRNANYLLGVLQAPLIESAATNVCLWSRDLTNAVWTKSGTGTATLNATGLDGTSNSATTISDTSAANNAQWVQAITVPVDSNTHALAFWVLKDADQTRFPELKAQITGGTAVRRGVQLNTQTGAIQVETAVGTTTQRVVDAGLWWVVEITLTNNSTASNTLLQAIVMPAGGSILGTFSIAAQGTCVFGQCQVELNTAAYTSAIFTTSASVTRAADVDSMYAATTTGYTRQTGSFITDGFIAGQEVAPSGFASNPASPITAVAATTLTVRDARTAEAAVAGRGLSINMPSDFAWENVKFTPTQGRPYVEENYIPGPMNLNALGVGGNLTAEPMYNLIIYVPQNSGIGADGGYADALTTLFAPSTEMTLTNGDKVFVRADIAPFRGMRQQISGNSVISLTIPLRIYTNNSI